MPIIIENGEYAVVASDVTMVYKSEIAGTETAPAVYLLTPMRRGISKASSFQMRFDDQGARDEFYKKLVDAMGQ